jgi:plastocyanin
VSKVGTRQPLRGALLIAVALPLSACGGAGGAGGGTGSASSPAQARPTPAPTPTQACEDRSTGPTFEVTLKDNVFEPTCLIVSGAQRPVLVNEGVHPHTFTIEGTTVDIEVDYRERLRGQPLRLDPGTYKVVCTPHAVIGMIGEIRVKA